jgi:hypothetical protein
MPKMSPLDLKAMLASEKGDALAAISAAELMEERAGAMDNCLGEMRKDMPAQEGRSRAVSTDVACRRKNSASSAARCIADCNYCFHEGVTKIESQLIAEGFDEGQIKSLDDYTGNTEIETLARDSVGEHFSSNAGGVNSAARLVRITEHYVRMDYEGEGGPASIRSSLAATKARYCARTARNASRRSRRFRLRPPCRCRTRTASSAAPSRTW